MYVKDYEFIHNINILFERPIIIYGAGAFGEKMAELLKELSVNFTCFCDRIGEKNKENMNHPIITLDELKEKTDKEDYLVIVGSREYCQDIIDSLQIKKVKAYVCTWYGISLGIELNIENIRIPESYRNDFIQRKEIYLKSYELYNHMRYVMDISKSPNAILIYQPAKVGSSTIYSSLVKNKVESVQIHFIAYNRWINENPKVQNNEMSYFRNSIRDRKRKVKIITMVREPIGRALSQFVHGFNGEFSDRCNDSHIERAALNWIDDALTMDYEFVWFDKELKTVTGIDIFQYPFDRERGYTWIREDNIEILVLKMERIDANEDIIGEFVGKPDFKLVHAGLGEEKCYRYIYKELKKQIKIPVEWLEQQYHDNAKVDFFYTNEEKKEFWDKWENINI